MRVVHFSAKDIGGGAAIAAHRLHQGLRRIGVDSRMIVAEKRSQDPSVEPTSRERTLGERIRRKLRDHAIRRSFGRYKTTRPPHLDCFSDDRAIEPRALPNGLPKADVYHLHWIAGFLDWRSFFRELPDGVPLLWTLHDMNPFTGGCHYTGGCDRFIEGCGACPALGSSDGADLSAAIAHRKRTAYGRRKPENLHIVGTSGWLSGEASRSLLFRPFPVSTIPYGLDTEVFRPRPRALAREVFGIPRDLRIILFVALSLEEHRKGGDLLMAALEGLDASEEVAIASVGTGGFATLPNRRHFRLGRLDNERLLSFAYSAADLFVTPAREEAFGQVVFEAMACGIPAVAFAVGGIPELVRTGVTGLLAPPGDVRALREAIEAILGDEEGRTRMARESRRVAVEEYRLELQAERYRALYRELLAGTGGSIGEGLQARDPFGVRRGLAAAVEAVPERVLSRGGG